jgi:formylglycine-generating enzyme required for sulfatase activity
VRLLATLQIRPYTFYPSQCSVAFSPDGSLLAGACGVSRVPIWDVPSLQLRHTLYDMGQRTVSCEFSPDGQMLACGGCDGPIGIWNPEDGEKIKDLGSHPGRVWEVDFSPSGQLLVSCADSALQVSGDVRLWRIDPRERLWIHKAPYNGFLSVSFHPSGESVAYSSIFGPVRVLDVGTGEPVVELLETMRHIGDLTYSPAGDLLAAGCDDHRIFIWDTVDYELLATLVGHQSYVNGVVFSADETWLVSGSDDKTVAIWAMEEFRLLKQLEGHEDTVLRVDLNPDNTLIASISWDGTVRLWGIPAQASASPPAQATLGDTWTRPGDGMVMLYVPGGTFQMGSSQAQIAEALELCDPSVSNGECPRALFDDETPQHTVTLDGFWIDQTEVTNTQYRLCLEAGVCQDTPCLSEVNHNAPDQPVGCVTWNDANTFCQWAGTRLPTEAEWEYAARGPRASLFPWGNTFDPTRLNYCEINCYSPWRDTEHDDGYNLAAPVGEFASGVSWCGALDMAGNVLEWVADWYDAGYYNLSPIENPQGPDSGTERVMRGGASNQNPSYQRTAWRSSLIPSGWYGLLGIRCAASSMSTHR